MKIIRPINNNIVTALDENGCEVIVVGTGIGFKAKEGTIIPKEKIQKLYRVSTDKSNSHLQWLAQTLPPKYFALTDNILSYAKEKLNNHLHEGIFITLADHINFAVERFKLGMRFQNVLLLEIKRFYPKEYEIGQYALKLMKKELNIEMPDDEAASIALHIFNAEYDVSVSDAFQVTVLLEHLVIMINEKTGFSIGDDYHSECLINYLKHLTQFIIKKDSIIDVEGVSCEGLEEKYPLESMCAGALSRYIKRMHNFEMPNGELSMLIHNLHHFIATRKNTEKGDNNV